MQCFPEPEAESERCNAATRGLINNKSRSISDLPSYNHDYTTKVLLLSTFNMMTQAGSSIASSKRKLPLEDHTFFDEGSKRRKSAEHDDRQQQDHASLDEGRKRHVESEHMNAGS